MYLIKSYLLLVSLCCFQWVSAQGTETGTPLEEGEIIYSLDNGNGVADKYGTGKKENYDIAIHLADRNLVGLSIMGMRIPMQGTENISNMSAWLSSELTLEKKDNKDVNAPDITSKAATPHEGYVEVRFDNPYTITAQGVYAGYSFEVAAIDGNSAKPVLLSSGAKDGGLYLHTSRTYRKWEDKSSSIKGNSAIQIIVGKVNANAVEICPIKPIDTQANVENTVTCTLINKGYKGATSIDCLYEVDGKANEQHIVVPETAIRYGNEISFNLVVPGIARQGVYPMRVTVTKVNGEENDVPTASATCKVNVYEDIVKHRAVLEEYTGTWCGYCPRGMVGLEKMNKLFPEDFIGISYHCNDAMSIMNPDDYPSIVTMYPYAWIDRVKPTDAYTGDCTDTSFGVDKVWEKQCKTIAPADITASAFIDENDGEKINVKANVSFVLPQDQNHYKVEFVLLADSLHGEGSGWVQTNDYSGVNEWAGDEDMKKFVEAGDKVAGLRFNDVIIARADADNSFPSSFEGGVPQEMTCRFDLQKAMNMKGVSLVQDKKNLRVAALLIDMDNGAIKNANKTKVLTPSGIDAMTTAGRQSSVYYDLSGRQMARPAKGICIKADTDSRGRTVYSKVLVN